MDSNFLMFFFSTQSNFVSIPNNTLKDPYQTKWMVMFNNIEFILMQLFQTNTLPFVTVFEKILVIILIANIL